MRKYSRQREAILKVLKNSKAHPSASFIYEEVRKEIPNISLGTVYRNLAELGKSGEILEISVGDGTERYDGDISPHIHFACRKCGKIIDYPLKNDMFSEFATESGFAADTTVCVVYGLCEECNRK
ncbi:MAG: transcriptional repressor [Clostridia bacterium]|nr:transcriptional repressor [Clostridia bacterium]